jgi:transcriptional regulator with XRE-family HTH domain
MDSFRKPLGANLKTLGANLRKARSHQNLTQQDVAESVDVPVEVYGRIERGAMLPRMELFVALCHRLGTTPDQLLGFSRSQPRPAGGATA